MTGAQAAIAELNPRKKGMRAFQIIPGESIHPNAKPGPVPPEVS